jgi:hypothetical protein
MIGMVGWLYLKSQSLSVEPIGVYQDIERDHTDEHSVRDVPYLLVAVLVMTTVLDVGERNVQSQPFTKFDRIDARGRKWMQLWNSQVEQMDDAQFDPPKGRRLIIKAFDLMEKVTEPS